MFLLSRKYLDRYLKLTLGISGLFSFLAVFLILLFLTKESLSFIFNVNLLDMSQGGWYPSENKFNLIPMVLGTLLSSLGALFLAIPLGLFSALFVSFYSSKRSSWFFKRVVELYAGIPSIIFGFWGLMNIVPLLSEVRAPGQSLLSGILILSLMIFPILTLNLFTHFDLEKKKTFYICESLGISKASYIWRVLLPSNIPHLLSSVILSLGRAIGETMAVLMVCGNIPRIPRSIFDPIRTLTSNIALEMSYATDNHRSSLFFSGLILLFIVSTLVILSNRVKKQWRY